LVRRRRSEEEGDGITFGDGLAFAFKAVAIALMIGAPLAGVWLASSLAAFANRAVWLPVAAGLLLFPGLPLAWEGIARYRQRDYKGRRFLTVFDRLVLRTLGINLLFLTVLLALFPQRAFLAASTRGDWMLEGHHGKTASSVRKGLLACAGAIEWIYKASNDNPYRNGREGQGDEADPTPVPTPTPKPTPVPTPTPVVDAGGAVASTNADDGGTALGDAGVVEAPVQQSPLGTTPFQYPFPAKLHPVVAAMPREEEVSVTRIGQYIKAREPDPMLRVKALHDWVADRIAYDTPNYVAHKVPDSDRDPEAVFRTRVGVCAGYAKLLSQLGKVTGDEILYIVGDARSEENPLEGESHAWNAAKINGAWYLIDVTWDSGVGDGNQFKKQYSTEYLFTPPDLFAITHFPDAPKWQLLEQPLSRAEFFRRPMLAPAFFTYGLGLASPNQSQVSVANAIDVTVDNPRKVFLLADFEPKGGGKRVECKGDRHTKVHCDFPAAGTYDVRLYANTKQYGNYTYAASVQVNARP
jgi:transglutaminase-like putative cysteine protease